VRQYKDICDSFIAPNIPLDPTLEEEALTYLSCGDHDTNLFDCLGEFLWFYRAVVI